MSEFFNHNEFTLEYFVFGNGPKAIFYFHGYGKTANEFLDYECNIAEQYTVYAFNFFHHGQSIYPENRIHNNTLTPGEFCTIITAFCEKQNINRFGLIGYSMGGKLSLILLNEFPQKVDFLILNAPDGIKRNFWYRFTARNKLGNKLYRGIIEKPRGFFALTRFFKSIRLLNPRLYEFVHNRLDTKEKRMHVYKVWMTLRLLDPDNKKTADIIKQHKIQVCLNYGKFDKVITPRYGEKFRQNTLPYSTFNLLEKGHNLVYPETGRLMEVFLRETCYQITNNR